MRDISRNAIGAYAVSVALEWTALTCVLVGTGSAVVPCALMAWIIFEATRATHDEDFGSIVGVNGEPVASPVYSTIDADCWQSVRLVYQTSFLQMFLMVSLTVVADTKQYQ